MELGSRGKAHGRRPLGAAANGGHSGAKRLLPSDSPLGGEVGRGYARFEPKAMKRSGLAKRGVDTGEKLLPGSPCV